MCLGIFIIFTVSDTVLSVTENEYTDVGRFRTIVGDVIIITFKVYFLVFFCPVCRFQIHVMETVFVCRPNVSVIAVVERKMIDFVEFGLVILFCFLAKFTSEVLLVIVVIRGCEFVCDVNQILV